ncbi:SLC13 family permease [Enterocloster citroniae]|uniref:SLC13 family permease n=1 Tax=Enterocloster citroniae TaxID=358743 RepID=UPI00304A73AF|nr:hypothetical protein [Enterocloster citroniae]
MSVGQISLMLGVFFIITIIISFVKKVNPGIVGLSFAIIAAIATGTKFKTLQAGFPVNVVLTLFSISLFFGYFIDNGTVHWIARKMLYVTKDVPKMMPFIFFFIALVLGSIGGANMVVFSVAIAFPVGMASGMKAWETGAICLIGTQCGSYLPWGTHGSTARAIIETMNDGAWADVSMRLNWKWWFTSFIVYIIVVIAFYFIFQNYKLKKIENVEQPGKLNHVQQLSLIQIGIVLLLVISMPLLAKKIDNPLFKAIAGMCDVVPLCLVGSLMNMLLGLGNEKSIIKNLVPWNTICMVFGMGMLVNLASTLGVFDYLTEVAEGIPAGLVGPVFLLIAGVMSLFSSSLSVVYPTVLPIAGLFAMNYGLNPVMALSVVIIGSATTAMSPLSGGGGQIMGACTEDICDNQIMFNKLFLTAFSTMIILFIEACIGLFGIFSL